MSATYQAGANAVRIARVSTVEILAELNDLRRKPDLDGDYPDLRTLAAVFGLPEREVNLALDALVGRTPAEAARELAKRGRMKIAETSARRSARSKGGIRAFVRRLLRDAVR